MGNMDSGKRIACPDCNGVLEEVYAEAKYGRVLLLDQCAVCKGVWFDKWELFLLKKGSAQTLHAIDGDSVNAQVFLRQGPCRCPKCSNALVDFNDPNLPKDAGIKRCPGCGGLWLTRHGLRSYSEKAEKKTFLDSALTAEERLKTLKNLQKELKASAFDTKADSLSAGLEAEPPLNTEEIVKDMGFLVLQMLLRTVFKF
jgi:Zn-finger nucleic acid-binding protein